MAELGGLFLSGAADSEATVQDEMMDFEYVRNCKDVNVLKAILKRLRDGKDGYYPDLIKATESRIMDVLPMKEKKKIEMLSKTASIKDIQEAESELMNWQATISTRDKSLITTSSGSNSKDIFTVSRGVHVPIRGAKPSGGGAKESSRSSSTTGTAETKDNKRISGYDFRAWETFDVDAAVSAVDIEDEKRQEIASQSKSSMQSEASSAASRRTRHHQNLMESLRAELGWGGISETTRSIKSGIYSRYIKLLRIYVIPLYYCRTRTTQRQ